MGPTFETFKVIYLYRFASKVFIWSRYENIRGLVTGAVVSTVAVIFLQWWGIDWEERNSSFSGYQDLTT